MPNSTAREHCSFELFWEGFKDWWFEKTHPDCIAAQQSHRTADSSNAPVWGLFLVVCAGVLAASVVFAIVSPLIAKGMSAAGAATIATGSGALATAFALLLLVGVPVHFSMRLNRFCRAMCLRGRELRSGVRQHACMGYM